MALMQTPQIRRPWGYRVHDVIWPDLPTPQITIWGALRDHHRVVPIRNIESPEDFCTVEVPCDASALHVCIDASNSCERFRSVKIQIARLERVFLADHMAVPPYERDAIRNAQIAAIRVPFGPTLPARRRDCRWQPVNPPLLQIVGPGDEEDLWPVLEVVVHFRHLATRRLAFPLHTDAGTVYREVTGALGITRNSGLRLPSYCPVERGAPLHLFLDHYGPHDPWNDPPPDSVLTWGLLDVRRVAQPPRPPYLMIQLPGVFDLHWLRETLAALMPEMAAFETAYMGPDMILEHCSPAGNIPLLTVFPDAHFEFEWPDFANCILDTNRLLDVRPGFRRIARVDRSLERQFPALPRGAATSEAAGTRGLPVPGTSLLCPVMDDEAPDPSDDDVLVFCPGQTPRCVSLSPMFRPDEILCSCATAVGLGGACTLSIPTLAPLVPGHVPSLVVIPSRLTHDRRFLLVDARRVGAADLDHVWLQESPAVLNLVGLIAALRRVAPNLRPIGAFYVDGAPIRGYTELTARVTLLTVLPECSDVYCLPTPLLNSRALRQRPGLMQLDCRYRAQHRRRRGMLTTTTTTMASATAESSRSLSATTTTTLPPPVPCMSRGTQAQTVHHRWIHFYLAVSGGHTVSATLT